MPIKQLKVYLAGPDVFFPDPKHCGENKKTLLAKYNLRGFYPLDNELNPSENLTEFALSIAKANEQLIQDCQIILANLDPWHGPGADNGTAFEMGYMSAKADRDPHNCLIIGYYSNGIPATFADRVSSQVYNGKVHQDTSGRLLSQDGFTIESFGLQDNLMLINAIEKTGGKIFGSFKEAVSNTTDLWQQKQCVIQTYTPMFKQKTMVFASLLAIGAACALTSYSRPTRTF